MRQYIGARYVPKFEGTWANNRTYEALSVVSYNGDSYTSKKVVPVGVAPTNTEYWALTGAYNSQVEEYRQEVVELADKKQNRDRYILFNGDSYGFRLNVQVLYPDVCASVMGLDSDHYTNACVARSNFVKTTSGYTKYQAQLQNFAGDREAVTDIVLCGGTNDLLDDFNDVITAMGEYVNYAKANYPNAKIWMGMLGWGKNSDSGANYASEWAIVRQAYQTAAAYGVSCILDLGQIYHYKPYISDDGVHPSDNGSRAIGYALASVLQGGNASGTFYNTETGINLTVDTDNFVSSNGKLTATLRENSIIIRSRTFNLVCQNTLTLTNTNEYHVGTISHNYVRGGTGTPGVGLPIVVVTSTTSYAGIAEIRAENDELYFKYRGTDITDPIIFISFGGVAVYDVIEI